MIAPGNAGTPANVDVCIYLSAASKTHQNLMKLYMWSLLGVRYTKFIRSHYFR